MNMVRTSSFIACTTPNKAMVSFYRRPQGEVKAFAANCAPESQKIPPIAAADVPIRSFLGRNPGKKYSEQGGRRTRSDFA